MECNGSLWRTEIRNYASCIEHNNFFYEESWHILLNPSLSSNNSYLCRPLSAVLSVCASLHITSSLQSLLFQSLSFSCLSLSLSLHPSVSAVFNQKLFHPVGSVGKYNVTNSVTDRHTKTKQRHLHKDNTFSQMYSIRHYGCT